MNRPTVSGAPDPASICTPLTLADFSVPYKPTFAPVEIAGLLGVSVRTIYREIESGDLRAVRVRGSWRIPLPELRAYLDRGQAVA